MKILLLILYHRQLFYRSYLKLLFPNHETTLISISNLLPEQFFEFLFLIEFFLWFGRPRADLNPRKTQQEKEIQKNSSRPLALKVLVQQGMADILSSKGVIGNLGRGDHSKLSLLGQIRSRNKHFSWLQSIYYRPGKIGKGASA